MKSQVEDTSFEQQEETPTSLSFTAIVYGSDPEVVSVKPGTTVGEFLSSKRWSRFEFQVNKKRVPDTHVLKEGDRVVVVPKAIEGGLHGSEKGN